MKVNFIIIKDKGMEYIIFLMELNMKVNFNQMVLKVMEYFIIIMEKNSIKYVLNNGNK